jgi:hypothetical protein
MTWARPRTPRHPVFSFSSVVDFFHSQACTFFSLQFPLCASICALLSVLFTLQERLLTYNPASASNTQQSCLELPGLIFPLVDYFPYSRPTSNRDVSSGTVNKGLEDNINIPRRSTPADPTKTSPRPSWIPRPFTSVPSGRHPQHLDSGGHMLTTGKGTENKEECTQILSSPQSKPPQAQNPPGAATASSARRSAQPRQSRLPGLAPGRPTPSRPAAASRSGRTAASWPGRSRLPRLSRHTRRSSDPRCSWRASNPRRDPP